jgi:hypothetical protein
MLISQESSSFVLLGTHSSLSPEHSYFYRAEATICCNSSLSLAIQAPYFAKIPLKQETFHNYSAVVFLAQIQLPLNGLSCKNCYFFLQYGAALRQ